MGNNSQETLRRVTHNDPSLTKLRLVGYNNYGVADGEFYSDNSDDYSTLGTAIANNTHLESLVVMLSDDLPLGVSDREFYDGLKANSSISNLHLCRNMYSINTPQNIAGGVGQEILQAYQENNSQLTFLGIHDVELQREEDCVIGDTLRNCRNLRKVNLKACNITYEQLLPIADAIRGHRMLEELNLFGNRIGNAGCDAIATLLEDPNCNLRRLDLERNAVNNEGATTIANSLTNNNKLHTLYLYRNPIDHIVQDVFSNILCNVSNINNTYSSNHALENLVFDHPRGQQLRSLLALNKDTNKSHIAIRKVLQYHPNMDMGSFFEWGMEEDGDQTLKALPYVVNWFGRAEVAVADEEVEAYRINDRKLSAIFQFAKAMPLLLEGVVNVRVDADNKRKRSDS